MAGAKAGEHKLSFFEDFMLGGISAGISKTAAAPLERIKLLLQNQREMIKSGRLAEPYRGPFDCLRRVVHTEGVGALWRGNGANVIRYFPTQAFNFAFKDVYKRLLHSELRPGEAYGSLRQWSLNILSGGLAGVSSLAFVYSLEFSYTRLANDIGAANRQYRGLLDVYRKTIQTDGISGLYRGFPISCLGIFLYRGCFFGFYDSLKPLVIRDDMQHNFFALFALGWAVDMSAGLLTYPVDTIRRRMMMTVGQTKEQRYQNALQAFLHVVRHEGPRALYHGGATNIVRSIAGALVLAAFDELRHFYEMIRYPVS